MAVTLREESRAGRIIDWLENSDAGLRLGISRLGAELISLQRRNAAGEWVAFLHRDNDVTAPQSGWGNHATVMGYFLHRLKNGRSLYRGHEIRGRTHSFLRSKNWHPVYQRDDAITYQITPEDFSPTEYPLNVSVELTYALTKDGAEIEFHFSNAEPHLSAHVSFGLHPGFAASSFESFEMILPAGLYRRHFSPDNFLSGETHDIEFGGGAMPFVRAELPGSFIIELLHVSSREMRFQDRASGRAVSIDLGGAPYLTLWSDGGAFLCVEPCWGLTDEHEQRAFEDKRGIQIIPAGGRLFARCRISAQLLDS